ncbi:transcription termination factor Rho [Mycolicibacterium palauense]|uniref:transcription termination factor Rho n=1 Tax=Mycolicibacterium palauense TaxID=2034511 RepID=UPI000BFEFBB4|nr:transcription termination factor Rho [Mycolicibacterium palauense]
MTDTDLITAAGSIDQSELPVSVNSDISASGGVSTGSTKAAATTTTKGAKGGGGLSSMVLPELRALAGKVGVKGTSGMRKGELIAAIQERQNSAAGQAPQAAAQDKPQSAPAEQPGRRGDESSQAAPSQAAPDSAEQPQSENRPDEGRRRERRSATRESGSPGGENQQDSRTENQRDNQRDNRDRPKQNDGAGERAQKSGDRNEGGRNEGRQDRRGDQQGSGDQQGNQQGRNNSNNNNSNNNNSNSSNNNSGNDDDGEGRQGRRGRRFRDRRRRGERSGGGDGGGDTEIREDDVLQPVAGILDVLDNYAFVRTSGYLAGPNDVYVSMNMVRKNGLRRGDAVTGAVRVPKEGEQNNQRQKFNPLVRLDSVNGGPVEDAKKRPEFGKLTPLYPNQRLRLETAAEKLTTRVIDLIMPIGKGQRALIVSPPKAGKTTIMQDIANAITRNNPECHLMVVLVDERPEEVTDMQRSVKGEVIASTFDRPPSDHTQAAELAIERAKRLVEQGKDVVVLLDSITRLGRAYNNASPASGRILSGGVDSTALYPPKRFLGAARNIEDGGSLTIIATAMVETGSTGDTVIFEEFKGTGNAELKLDRKIAERRVFPAVDVNPSGTRKDELLLSPDEFAIVHKLRRVLSGLDSHQAIDLLMSQLRKTKNNYEFLVQVSKTAPGSPDDVD